MYRDVDLSVARSLAAGTAETLPIVGNMLYVDQKANSGYAVLHVQDDSYVGNTPITAFSGFLVRVPFTQVLFENVAQPGKVMRLIYGTDIDFVPTVGAGVSILNAVNVNDVIAPNCQIISVPTTAPGIGTTIDVLLAPAANPSGFTVREFEGTVTSGGGGNCRGQLIASQVAPVAIGAGLNRVSFTCPNSNAGVTQSVNVSWLNRTLPAGWGLYWVHSVTVVAGSVDVRVSLEVLA